MRNNFFRRILKFFKFILFKRIERFSLDSISTIVWVWPWIYNGKIEKLQVIVCWDIFFDFLEKYRELEPVYQATGKNSTPYDEYTERPYDDGRFSLKERVLVGNDIRYDMPMYNEKKKNCCRAKSEESIFRSLVSCSECEFKIPKSKNENSKF